MAILHNGRIRVTTAAGVPISGGKLRIRDAGTSNLTTVYSDAGLSVALTNPVVADSEGWCPTVHAADGTVVDVAHLTAGDVVLWTQDDHVFVGQSSSTLVRDFTTSRFQVRGSGGTTHIETGDASGDDTGGTARMGGWAGSQGTTLSLDYASVDVETAGAFTEDGKQPDGFVYTAATTFSASTQVDVELPNSPAGVIAWDVIFWDLANSSDCQYRGRFSYDNAATYKSGASDYFSAVHAAYNSTTGSLNDATQDYLQLTGVVNVKVSTGGFLTLRIISVTSGSGSTAVDSKMMASDATGSLPAIWTGGHGGLGGYGKTTHFRLYPSAGNITGKYRVVPRRGFA